MPSFSLLRAHRDALCYRLGLRAVRRLSSETKTKRAARRPEARTVTSAGGPRFADHDGGDPMPQPRESEIEPNEPSEPEAKPPKIDPPKKDGVLIALGMILLLVLLVYLNMG
jgi:hypothetical protein